MAPPAILVSSYRTEDKDIVMLSHRFSENCVTDLCLQNALPLIRLPYTADVSDFLKCGNEPPRHLQSVNSGNLSQRRDLFSHNSLQVTA